MSKEKQLFEDLVEIFEEEYEKRRLITPQNTAEKMTAKGYRKQSEGEWEEMGQDYANCSVCGTVFEALPTLYAFKQNNIYCRHCGAKMKGGAE